MAGVKRPDGSKVRARRWLALGVVLWLMSSLGCGAAGRADGCAGNLPVVYSSYIIIKLYELDELWRRGVVEKDTKG